MTVGARSGEGGDGRGVVRRSADREWPRIRERLNAREPSATDSCIRPRYSPDADWGSGSGERRKQEGEKIWCTCSEREWSVEQVGWRPGDRADLRLLPCAT